MVKLTQKKRSEKRLIGSCIHNPRLFPYVTNYLNERDLEPEHTEIYKEMLDCYSNTPEPSDFELLSDRYIENIDEFTGAPVIHDIPDILAEGRIWRNLYLSIEAEKLYKTKLKEINKVDNGEKFISEVIEASSELLHKTESVSVVESLSDKLSSIFERIESEATSKSNTGIRTKSIPSFNTATGGLLGGNVVIIAGAYKNGKSTFALNLALDIMEQGEPCGWFSYEMNDTEMENKIIGMLSGIDYGLLRDPRKLDDNDKRKLGVIYQKYRTKMVKYEEPQKVNGLIRRSYKEEKFPLYIEAGNLDETTLRLKIDFLVNKKGVKLIVIDQIGNMISHKKFDSRERELSYFSTYLKRLAREYNIPIIVLAQLNRAGKGEASSINLAESISMARDCDFLLTIQYPHANGVHSLNDNKGLSYFKFTEDDFLITLDTSRHTKPGKKFILRLIDGRLQEIKSQYDNAFNETSEYDRFLEEEKSMI